MEIQGSVALVTGANRGLGRAFVDALRARGARKIYAAVRDPASLDLPRGVEAIRLDVTKPEQVEAAAKAARDVTLLVNNAGILVPGALTSLDTLATARAEIETNYLGPLALGHAFAPVLAGNGGGAIVNVLSALSWVALPGLATYSASKAAAWAFSNGLRHELTGQGTQVLGVHVGYVDTDMTAAVTAPKSAPADVVRVVLDALEAGQSEVLADETSRQVKAALSAGVYLTVPNVA